MQQTFRRQLLAFGQLEGNQARVDGQCREFIRSVLAAKIDMRPHTEAVLDVLLSDGAATAVATSFAETFDAAVWRIVLRPAL